jgi:hypothetical protein
LIGNFAPDTAITWQNDSHLAWTASMAAVDNRCRQYSGGQSVNRGTDNVKSLKPLPFAPELRREFRSPQRV